MKVQYRKKHVCERKTFSGQPNICLLLVDVTPCCYIDQDNYRARETPSRGSNILESISFFLRSFSSKYSRDACISLSEKSLSFYEEIINAQYFLFYISLLNYART